MKTRCKNLFLLPALWAALATLNLQPSTAFAQGSLDPAFGTGTGAEDDVQALAVQNDGKIIAAGLFYNINGTANSLGIARLNANGAVDGGFNPGTSVDYGINSVAVQPDGKIVFGGGFTMYQGESRNGITRIYSDGSLDTTFNPGTGVNDQIASVALQPDGKIVIAGYFTSYNGTARSGIARVNTNGTLDVTFNPGTGVNFAVWSSRVLGNGQILLGGGFTSYNGTERRGVARINSDGSLDATFNPGSTSVNDLVRVAIAQSDGKVIVGGDFTTFNSVARSRIARLNADGTLDTSFNPGTGADASVMALAVQPNGKVLAGGSFTAMNSVSLPHLARLLPNGAVDSNFNPGTGANGNVLALALQTNGAVVLGGQFTTFESLSNVRLARLLLNDPLPPLIVASITSSAGNFILSWPAANNAVYRVDYKNSLSSANWSALSNYVTAAGSTAAMTNNPGGDTQRWYRMAWLPF
jgi:uncharacterized delta-60 repeat protein